jgi:hypothetical protein
LSPTSWHGLGSFTLNRERNIAMNFRVDAINLLNHPIRSTPSANIDSTSFGPIASANGNRSVNLTVRVTW